MEYNKIRFFLFVNSYSGKRILTYLKQRTRGRKLTYEVKRLSDILDFKNEQINDLVLSDIKPDSPYKRLSYPLKIYLETEKELAKLSEERLDEYSTALEDYQRQLLYPAIERAVGNLIEEIVDDDKFDKLLNEKLKSATHIYYKIAYKYKLPTLRIVPFILRLISQ